MRSQRSVGEETQQPSEPRAPTAVCADRKRHQSREAPASAAGVHRQRVGARWPRRTSASDEHDHDRKPDAPHRRSVKIQNRLASSLAAGPSDRERIASPEQPGEQERQHRGRGIRRLRHLTADLPSSGAAARHPVLGRMRHHVVVAAGRTSSTRLGRHRAHIGRESARSARRELAAERRHAVRPALADGGDDVLAPLP